MSRLLCLCLAVFLAAFAYAQEVPVKFSIVGAKGEPLGAATVTVIAVADSMLTQTKTADSLGRVVFTLLQNSLYIVRASSVNYEPLQINITVKGDAPQFRLVAKPLSKTLNTVVVTARRPLIRQEDDKTIVDPEPLANVSTNAYEIMEKTPGLFVDPDGNIYISSTTPAKVYINGREQRMSAADVATILKSLPPNAISSIEILRMPSAKYDASGSGGVVNIVLKKGIKIGLTGSINIGANQGHYGNQFAGFNLNNSDGKRAYYINVNYNRRNSFDRIQTDRFLSKDTLLQQDAFTTYPATNYFLSYGYSDSLGKKWFLDFAGSVIYQTFDNQTANTNRITNNSNHQILSNSLNKTDYSGNYFRVNNGITFSRKIGSTADWSNDFYFSYDQNRINQQYSNVFSLPFSFSSTGYGSPDNDRNNFVFTSDFKKKFRQNISLEAGVKSSVLSYHSDAAYFKNETGGAVKDFSRTNKFQYTENINAAYLQASKTFAKDVILKAGARLENTNMNGHQVIPSDTTFAVHRTDLFPYAYLSKKLMKIAGYDLRAFLVYRRTIARPGYDQLNPFAKYVDQYLSERGNPALRPQFTQTYEANISVDERPIFAVGMNDTKDIFNQVIYQADSNKTQAYRTYDNLGKNREMYFRALGALPPGKKYFFVIGAQYNHNFYEGTYENKPLSFKRGSWRFFTYHNFKATSTTNIFVNGFLMTNGQLQFYEVSNFGQLNMGISQQLMSRKLTLNLSLQDLFYTNKNDFVLRQGSVSVSGSRKTDSQRVGLFLRYNFGIRKKEEQKLPDAESVSPQRP
ncbi:outer membrane beta-barrel protein [Flavisolibacter ginsenosidimutans]|nr:outer membrane beta-barrel protein [Flavisolibacter ginsenosidimutans]